MPNDESFAQRVRQRFPEGLTSIVAVGGTRTTYILENNRYNADPGQITNFEEYATLALDRYFSFIQMYLELGGQNIIVPLLGYQRFYEKGQEYARMIAQLSLWLTNERSVHYYKEMGIDPYFAGIDVLLHLPSDHVGHQLAKGLTEFQQNWKTEPGRCKVIWEVAPIPLYSIWQADKVMGQAARAELDDALEQTTDLDAIDQLTYGYYARALYGTDLPMPHFYLGTNRKQDLKIRSMLPFALYSGVPLRLYYIPYPPLMMKREGMKAIIEDLAFGKPLASREKDYQGQYTSELAQSEYQRLSALSEDPLSTFGLVQQNLPEQD